MRDCISSFHVYARVACFLSLKTCKVGDIDVSIWFLLWLLQNSPVSPNWIVRASTIAFILAKWKIENLCCSSSVGPNIFAFSCCATPTSLFMPFSNFLISLSFALLSFAGYLIFYRPVPREWNRSSKGALSIWTILNLELGLEMDQDQTPNLNSLSLSQNVCLYQTD